MVFPGKLWLDNEMQWRHPLSLSIAQNMVAQPPPRVQQEAAEQVLKSNLPPTALLTPSPPIVASPTSHLPAQLNYKNLITLREMLIQQQQQQHQLHQQPILEVPHDPTSLSSMKRTLIEQSLPNFAQSLVATTKNINSLLANFSASPTSPTHHQHHHHHHGTASSTVTATKSPSPPNTSTSTSTSTTMGGSNNNFMLSELNRKYENKIIEDPNEDDDGDGGNISVSSDAEKRKLLYQQEMQLKIQQQHLQQQQEELNRQQEAMNKQREQMMNNNEMGTDLVVKKEMDTIGDRYGYGSGGEEVIPKKRRRLSTGELRNLQHSYI
jgi:hypothetical protein